MHLNNLTENLCRRQPTCSPPPVRRDRAGQAVPLTCPKIQLYSYHSAPRPGCQGIPCPCQVYKTFNGIHFAEHSWRLFHWCCCASLFCYLPPHLTPSIPFSQSYSMSTVNREVTKAQRETQSAEPKSSPLEKEGTVERMFPVTSLPAFLWH